MILAKVRGVALAYHRPGYATVGNDILVNNGTSYRVPQGLVFRPCQAYDGAKVNVC